jgi:D-sedoheptulose 7-phosphate isomerase
MSHATKPRAATGCDGGVTAYLQHIAETGRRIEATSAGGHPLPLDAAMALAVEWVCDVGQGGGKIVSVGNGGSAAVASHLQMDLCNAARIRALTFTDAPMMTALANDHGYESAYPRSAALWLEERDLLVAISSSGRSRNILRTIETARRRRCRCLTLSGFAPDNPLRALGDLNLWVPSKSYGCVELLHGILAHMLTDLAVAARPLVGHAEPTDLHGEPS